MSKKRQNGKTKKKFDEVKKNRGAIIAGWEDEGGY